MILIVEDNPTQQKVLAYLAKQQGFEAEIVSTGSAAISCLQKPEQYELMLLDWTLPDMTGLECTQAIRQSEKDSPRHIPIVAMTGHVAEGDRERCLRAGMDDYLSKPFTVQEFNDVVHRWTGPQPPAHDFPFGPDFAGGESHATAH